MRHMAVGNQSEYIETGANTFGMNALDAVLNEPNLGTIREWQEKVAWLCDLTQTKFGSNRVILSHYACLEAA